MQLRAWRDITEVQELCVFKIQLFPSLDCEYAILQQGEGEASDGRTGLTILLLI
jgi:hypothetical protein